MTDPSLKEAKKVMVDAFAPVHTRCAFENAPKSSLPSWLRLTGPVRVQRVNDVSPVFPWALSEIDPLMFHNWRKVIGPKVGPSALLHAASTATTQLTATFNIDRTDRLLSDFCWWFFFIASPTTSVV
jgi:hypothetical protein